MILLQADSPHIQTSRMMFTSAWTKFNGISCSIIILMAILAWDTWAYRQKGWIIFRIQGAKSLFTLTLIYIMYTQQLTNSISFHSSHLFSVKDIIRFLLLSRDLSAPECLLPVLHYPTMTDSRQSRPFSNGYNFDANHFRRQGSD